ncbi:MAG: CCA tRNA nucleotidyltransferase [Proteobacteria bacterium]|nr:CCA tRNA nucleotidyltransferase [Pseudomonadota bacterium]
MLTHIEENTSLWFIIDTLKKNGFQGYIAGGAVRDILLQKKPDDFDILTNASIKELTSLFKGQKVKTMGKTFPICTINGIEISSGRAKFHLSDFPESDLAQRDFTINSMAWDPISKKIIDPFNGKKDLEDAMIRFTKDPEKRIAEDPARMVRACRFAALINGSFSLSSLELILANKDKLDTLVAKERILREIIKAMGLKRPSLFFKALKKTGLLSKIFPSLDRCHGLDGGPHHGETVFEHSMMVGDALPENLPVLRLAGFLHDVGKFDAAKKTDGRIIFAGHENETKAVIHDLERLRFSNKDIAYITSLINTHMRPLTDQTTPKAARRLLSMLDKSGLDYGDFMRMRIADKKGNLAKRPYTISQIRIRLKKLFAQMQGQKAFQMNHLKISGNDIIRILGIAPGPDVGKIKQQLFEMVLDDPELNNYNDLKKLCLSL